MAGYSVCSDIVLVVSFRAYEQMISGLLCSEDILYFVIVISMFLLLSILKLQSTRQRFLFHGLGKISWRGGDRDVVGTIVSSVMCYYDATETKRNTLTPNSQEGHEQVEDNHVCYFESGLLYRNAQYSKIRI